MSLRIFLRKIFPNREEAKYSSLINDLKDLGIDSVSDLKYLNDETAKCLKSFKSIEISKLIDNYNNSKFSKFFKILVYYKKCIM